MPDVVPKAGLRLIRADHEHFGDAGQRVAHLGEEFLLRSNRAGVLTGGVDVRLGFHGVGDFGIELQGLGLVVFDVERSVQE